MGEVEVNGNDEFLAETGLAEELVDLEEEILIPVDSTTVLRLELGNP